LFVVLVLQVWGRRIIAQRLVLPPLRKLLADSKVLSPVQSYLYVRACFSMLPLLIKVCFILSERAVFQNRLYEGFKLAVLRYSDCAIRESRNRPFQGMHAVCGGRSAVRPGRWGIVGRLSKSWSRRPGDTLGWSQTGAKTGFWRIQMF